MEAKATLRLARVSAQKARLVADMVRGLEVGEAIEILSFTRKKSAPMIRKLVESAIANAEHKARLDNVEVDLDSLFVKQILVDQGPHLRRFRPRARGMANRIHKKTSHITVVVGEEVL